MKGIFKYIIGIVCIVLTYNSNAQSITYTDKSVLSEGVWYSVSITSDGIYKLTYNDFITLGVDEKEIDFDNLSIFGNGGKAIDEIVAGYKFSDLKENAIYVNKQEKYALFYAQATTQTIYNSEKEEFSFSLHPYATETKYFITFEKNIGEKKRISNITYTTDETTLQLNTAKDYVFYKRELYNLSKSGRYWFGEKFSPVASELQIPISLPNINSEKSANIKIQLLANSSKNSSFDIKLNNNDLGQLNISSVSSGEVAHAGLFLKDTIINNVANNFFLKFNSSVATSEGWLDYILINYEKKLTFNNNYLKFYCTKNNSTENVRYNIDNVLSANTMVWDVTDITNVKNIENKTFDNRILSFDVKANTLRTLIILSGSTFPTPTLEDTIVNQNLHGIDSAEFVIITHKKFMQQAQRLAEIHRQYDSISVAVVELQQVYNEFSSGTKDFLAMREFIRMMYNKSNKQYPKNVLLFGDGTFDNKNILQLNNNYMPTYQSPSFNKNTDANFTSDDVLAAIGESSTNHTYDTLFVGIGRIPANDTTTASIIVDKCRRYLTKEDILNKENGEWRNVVMLTSDDADDATELYFRNNAEHIYYQIDESNPGLNVQKVYEDAYKEYNSSAGSTYPDASKAINERMKKGCLLFNYLGHGSPDHLSSESLITITDITSWTNYNKLCLMITSTCEFNRFDLAETQSAGEYMLTSPNGAGIGLIAAARKISSNDPINKALFKYALEKQDDGKNLSFGQVMQYAKNLVNSGYYGSKLATSERSITFIGDPALRLSLPKYNVRTLKINETIYDTLTETFSKQDTLRALSSVTIEGEITDMQGKRIDDFNGTIQISLYDKKTYYYMLNNSNLEISKDQLAFEQQNSILHKGSTMVTNGVFSHSFTIPKDIAYNYGNGKLSYYAQDDSTDASGYCTDFILGGIDTNSLDFAMSSPQINLYLNDSNFVSGGICDENPSLFAVIYDTIPINTVGSGLGHDIVARLDNAANTFILNDYYTTDEKNPNRGFISYPLKNLTTGTHTLTLKVWNIYNKSSEKTITFIVSDSDNEEYQIINYPNPFKESTDIELRFNQPNSITSAYIKIFNQQGGIVTEFDISDRIGTYNVGPVHWDGKTSGGARLQNGIYFYKIILHTTKGDMVIKSNKMMLLK